MSPKPKVTATQKTLAKIVVSAAAPTLPPVDQSVDSTPVDNPNPEIPKDCKQMEQGLYCELVKIIPGPSEGTFSYYCNYYFKDGRYESVLVLDSAADELQEPVCANPETLPKSDEPTL